MPQLPAPPAPTSGWLWSSYLCTLGPWGKTQSRTGQANEPRDPEAGGISFLQYQTWDGHSRSLKDTPWKPS